ncbi:MAG: hypothetical protein ACLU8D_05220 [Enterocloster sp.]
MKYAVILGDGMADLPEACPGGRTPLELARTPVLDRLCGGGETGLVRTVPEGMAPGSDTANLSILGYGGKHITWPGVLEALALGICLGVHDLAFRCDLTVLETARHLKKCRWEVRGPWREKKKRLTYP